MALGGGTFLTQNKILPGAYINFISVASASATLSDRGIATIPLEMNWGPEGEVITVELGDFQKNSQKIFGYAYTADELKPMAEGIHLLIQSVYDDSVLDNMFTDGHGTKVKENPLNENFAKKEFQTADGTYTAVSTPSIFERATIVDQGETDKYLGLQNYWSYVTMDVGSGDAYANVASGNLVYQKTDFANKPIAMISKIFEGDWSLG